MEAIKYQAYEAFKTGLGEGGAKVVMGFIDYKVEKTMEHFSKNLATKNDVMAVRIDLTKEMGHVRSDLTKEMGHVKSDLTKEIGQVKSDLTMEIGQVRSDFKNEIGQVRSDLDDKTGSLRSDLTDKMSLLRSDLTDKMSLLSSDLTRTIYKVGLIQFVSIIAVLIGMICSLYNLLYKR